jgi:hypothetical protein
MKNTVFIGAVLIFALLMGTLDIAAAEDAMHKSCPGSFDNCMTKCVAKGGPGRGAPSGSGIGSGNPNVQCSSACKRRCKNTPSK